MSTPDVGRRRPSPSTDRVAAAGTPVLAQVETPPLRELSVDQAAVDQSRAAALVPLAPHSEDQQMADRIAALQAQAREVNEKFDAFDPASLKRTRDVLIELERAAEAISLQRRILQFLVQGPQRLVELQTLATLCIAAGRSTDAVNAIETARLEYQGPMMKAQVRAELAVSAAFARLLDGDVQGAQRELDKLGPHHYDDQALMLRAMIKHERGDHEEAKAATRDLRKPAHRVLLDLWCKRPGDALAGLDEFVRTSVPPPGIALPKDARDFAQLILFSPIVACSPLREVLTGSDSWQLLRGHCQTVQLGAIAVNTLLPDMKPHVLTVLAGMQAHSLAQIAAGMDVRTDEIYQLISPYYKKWNDPRINPGVTMGEKGSRLLAEHFNRTYGTQISIHVNVATASIVLVQLIDRAANAPDDVRSSLNFGVAHGVCVVYIREKKNEALFLFDSLAEIGKTPAAIAIQEALRRIGRVIPVYRQAVPTQSGSYGCFVQSMSAAVTLTRRVAGEPGNFMIPNLISELEAMRVEGAEPDPFIPTTALPEIAKMSQTPALLAEHLRARADTPLRDSERGLSTEGFVREHVVRIEHGGANVDVFDCTRKMGLQCARDMEIEAWNQAILGRVGPQAWSLQQQNEFAATVSVLSQPRTESLARAEPEAKR